MTCLSAAPLSVEEVDAALKESRGSSGPPLTGLYGVSESDLLRVRATVEKVNRLSDEIDNLKAIIAKNHRSDLGLMRERDELAKALRGMLDAEPYASDTEDCECGDWDEAAAREDMAPTCRHTKAHVALAAIAKARGE